MQNLHVPLFQPLLSGPALQIWPHGRWWEPHWWDHREPPFVCKFCRPQGHQQSLTKIKVLTLQNGFIHVHALLLLVSVNLFQADYKLLRFNSATVIQPSLIVLSYIITLLNFQQCQMQQKINAGPWSVILQHNLSFSSTIPIIKFNNHPKTCIAVSF